MEIICKEAEFAEVDWIGYRKQIENTLKVNKMAVLNNTLTLKWIDEQIKKLPKKCKQSTKKEEEKNTNSQSS